MLMSFALEIPMESNRVLEIKINQTGQVSPRRTQISPRNLVLAEVWQASCAKLQFENIYAARASLPRVGFCKLQFFFLLDATIILPQRQMQKKIFEHTATNNATEV